MQALVRIQDLMLADVVVAIHAVDLAFEAASESGVSCPAFAYSIQAALGLTTCCRDDRGGI